MQKKKKKNRKKEEEEAEKEEKMYAVLAGFPTCDEEIEA